VLPLAESGAFVAPSSSRPQSGKELAAVGNQFAEKYINAKLEVDAADQSAELSSNCSRAQFDASKIPDRQKATEHYDARSQEILDAYAQSGRTLL